MKRIPLFFMTLLFPIMVQAADPPPSAPKMINLQAVLVDDGGNVLYDKQEADIVFSVIDGDGETLYEEVQHVPIVNGAISVLIGNGKNIATGEQTGGIPMEALLPDGSKLLRIKLNEQSIPQEDLQLVSVPYALYAESLSHPIESDEVLDGTLAQADLSAELVSSLENSMTTLNTNSLATHRTESGAHPARSISVENNFTHASGTDLQTVLSGLDSAIGARRNQEGELVEDIGDEAATRSAADATETATRSSEDERVLASEISRAGDTIYGDLTFYTDDTLTTQTIVLTPSTGNITTSGELSLLDGLVTIERDAATDEPVFILRDTTGAERFSLLAETGLLTLDGDASVTGGLTASAFTGSGSGLTNLNGSNITSGTVADDRIASSLTRDSEADTAYVNAGGDTMSGGLNLGSNSITNIDTVTARVLEGNGAAISSLNADNISSGTLVNARLSSSVSLLGQSIESSEVTSLDASKITTGTLANERLASNVSKLGQSIESVEVADGTITSEDLGFTVNPDPDGGGPLAPLRSIDDRYVNVVGDTMTCDTNGDGAPDSGTCLEVRGNLAMGATADIIMGEDRVVDGVDVSFANDQVVALVNRVFNSSSIPASIAGSVTGLTPPDSSNSVDSDDPATLNIENRLLTLENRILQSGVFAWASVNTRNADGNRNPSPSTINDFNFVDSVERAPARRLGGNYSNCAYKLTFEQRAAGINTYTAVATINTSSSDNVIHVRATEETYIIVEVLDAGSSGDDCGSSEAIENFNVVVVGH